jgi:hypothetical protein
VSPFSRATQYPQQSSTFTFLRFCLHSRFLTHRRKCSAASPNRRPAVACSRLQIIPRRRRSRWPAGCCWPSSSTRRPTVACRQCLFSLPGQRRWHGLEMALILSDFPPSIWSHHESNFFYFWFECEIWLVHVMSFLQNLFFRLQDLSLMMRMISICKSVSKSFPFFPHSLMYWSVRSKPSTQPISRDTELIG